ETERARAGRGQPHRGPLKSWQGSTYRKVGKHHPGGAVTGFLAVEGDLQRHALPGLDHIGAVSAPHRHYDPLHPISELCGARPAGPEEEPPQPPDSHHGSKQDADVGDAHDDLPSTSSAIVPTYTP